MRKASLMLIIVVALAFVARAGIVMPGADGMSGMDGGCVGAFCPADHGAPADADCLGHCLAAGTIHPVDAIAASLLLLLGTAVAFVAYAAESEGAIAARRGRRSPDGPKALSLRFVASDVLRE